MEEHPEQHDFDQRHDGPEEAAQVPYASGTNKERPSQDIRRSGEGGESSPIEESQSLPHPLKTRFEDDGTAVQSPTSPDAAGFAAQGRRSTQISRSGRRTSRDFDVRRDGPYGRPSITMVRRTSSGLVPMSPSARVGTENAVEDEANKEAEGADGANGAPTSPTTARRPTQVEAFQSTDAAFEPEPPPLNYTLHTRKMSIFLFWSLILIDSIAMPIALYFGLWYGTDLSPNTVFSIVTAALGGASIIEYFLRFWRLWKKGSTCRVIGARRMYLDWFHWNFTFAWIIVMIELIVGSVPENPPIRLLSMPLATMCYTFGTELMIVDIMRYFEMPAPLRISSIPKGAQLRPCIYSIIEDVCAVDGSGGTEFRENLNRRYEASHVFRAMLRRLGFFWAVGSQTIAVVTTIVVFTATKDEAYVVGWSVPFVWAGIWVWITIWYVRRKLAEEKTAWAEEVAAKSNA